MNAKFVYKNDHHRNLVAKLKNSMVDLNFYAHRFLQKAGIPSTDRTGISDARAAAKKGKLLPSEVLQIIVKSEEILKATPENADHLFYTTWVFLHDFDHLFKL